MELERNPFHRNPARERRARALSSSPMRDCENAVGED